MSDGERIVKAAHEAIIEDVRAVLFAIETGQTSVVKVRSPELKRRLEAYADAIEVYTNEELRRHKEALGYATNQFARACQVGVSDDNVTFDMQIRSMLEHGKFLTNEDFIEIFKEMLGDTDEKDITSEG